MGAGGGGGGGGDDEKAQLGVYDGRLVEVLPRRPDDNRDELRVCISGEDLRDVGDEIVVKTIDVSFDNETVEDGLREDFKTACAPHYEYRMIILNVSTCVYKTDFNLNIQTPIGERDYSSLCQTG